jgi:O-antigen/teichoic acid export membrane protein
MNISRLFAGHLVWRGLYLLTSTLVTVLMARYLEAAATGWVFYFISWLSFFFLAATFGMDASITFFVSSGKAQVGEILGFALAWALLVAVVSGLLIFGLYHQNNQHMSMAATRWAAVFFIAGNVLITFLNALFYSRRDFITPNVLYVAVNLFLIGWLLQGTGSGDLQLGSFSFLEVYFLLIFLQGVCSLFLFLAREIKDFHFRRPSWQLIKQVLAYSGIAYLANLAFFACTRIDYWILEAFHVNESSLGNYIQASRLVQLFQLIPSMLAASVFPIAAAGQEQKMKEGILRLARFIFILYLLPVLFLACSGKWLFPFLFGQSFHEMYEVFLCLLPGLFSLSALALISAYFAAINRVMNNLKISVAGMFLILIGDWIFIPSQGIYGAAWVSSVGYVFCFAGALWFFAKETEFHWFDFFIPRKSDFSFLRSVFFNLFSKSSTKQS